MSRELLQDSQCLTRKGQGTGPRAIWVRTEHLSFLQDVQPPVTPAFLGGLDSQHMRERCLWGRCQCPLRSEAEQVRPAMRAREPSGAALDGDCGQAGSVP